MWRKRLSMVAIFEFFFTAWLSQNHTCLLARRAVFTLWYVKFRSFSADDGGWGLVRAEILKINPESPETSLIVTPPTRFALAKSWACDRYILWARR